MLKRARALDGSAALAAIASFAAAALFAGPASAFKASTAIQAAGGALTKGYQAAPALMLGLALAFGLSLITLLSFARRPAALPAERSWRHKGDSPATDYDVAESAPDLEAAALHPFLEFDDARGGRCSLLRDMLRIGREDDNDIRIPAESVQRYHAAIHREDYDDWHITALSGAGSFIVNGKRCSEALLHDGDVIQLGPGRMRFRAG